MCDWLFVEQLESLSVEEINIEIFFLISNRELRCQTAGKSLAGKTENQETIKEIILLQFSRRMT